jgi:hypothetical protein
MSEVPKNPFQEKQKQRVAAASLRIRTVPDDLRIEGLRYCGRCWEDFSFVSWHPSHGGEFFTFGWRVFDVTQSSDMVTP